jgi:hypothetical protein
MDLDNPNSSYYFVHYQSGNNWNIKTNRKCSLIEFDQKSAKLDQFILTLLSMAKASKNPSIGQKKAASGHSILWWKQ